MSTVIIIGGGTAKASIDKAVSLGHKMSTQQIALIQSVLDGFTCVMELMCKEVERCHHG